MVDRAPPSRVTVERHDFVALLTINRPERHNAVDLPILRAIREAQSDVLDKGGRAMVITGTPPAFCSGADLSGAHEEEFASALDEVVHGMTTMPIVTVACINGPALGAGAQIALSCDIRVASADSVIGVPAAKLGLVVSHWTIERLVRELSWPVARAMLLTARLYTGAELNQLGSVHRIGDVNDALLWAQEIAALAPYPLLVTNSLWRHRVLIHSSTILSLRHGNVPGGAMMRLKVAGRSWPSAHPISWGHDQSMKL